MTVKLHGSIMEVILHNVDGEVALLYQYIKLSRKLYFLQFFQKGKHENKTDMHHYTTTLHSHFLSCPPKWQHKKSEYQCFLLLIREIIL
jgi:hypothetical protein